MSDRYTGKIKFFLKDKGFGFIICEEFAPSDVFLSINDVPEGMELLPNTDVTFECQKSKKGYKAFKVQLVE